MYGIQFGVTKARGELALSAAAQRGQRILNATVSLAPGAPDEEAKSTFQQWTPELVEAIREWIAHGRVGPPPPALLKLTPPGTQSSGPPAFYHLSTRQQQAPNPDSRVTLSPERGALGIPRATLTWRPAALGR